jgi:hypothetical protein
MGGSELLVKYDIGLDFGELLDRMIRPETAIRNPDGLGLRLGLFSSIEIMPMQIEEDSPTPQYNPDESSVSYRDG